DDGDLRRRSRGRRRVVEPGRGPGGVHDLGGAVRDRARCDGEFSPGLEYRHRARRGRPGSGGAAARQGACRASRAVCRRPPRVGVYSVAEFGRRPPKRSPPGEASRPSCELLCEDGDPVRDRHEDVIVPRVHGDGVRVLARGNVRDPLVGAGVDDPHDRGRLSVLHAVGGHASRGGVVAVVPRVVPDLVGATDLGDLRDDVPVGAIEDDGLRVGAVIDRVPAAAHGQVVLGADGEPGGFALGDRVGRHDLHRLGVDLVDGAARILLRGHDVLIEHAALRIVRGLLQPPALVYVIFPTTFRLVVEMNVMNGGSSALFAITMRWSCGSYASSSARFFPPFEIEDTIAPECKFTALIKPGASPTHATLSPGITRTPSGPEVSGLPVNPANLALASWATSLLVVVSMTSTALLVRSAR